MEETLQQKNERKLNLFSELGGVIGPIVERESSIDSGRVIDCIDCLMAHVAEILSIHYKLDTEIAQNCFKIMRGLVQQEIQSRPLD